MPSYLRQAENHDDDCDCGLPKHKPPTVSPEQPISVPVSVVEEALGCMVIDTACQKLATGSGWLEWSAQRMQTAGLEILFGQEHEVFKFGAGGPQVSRTRARVPAGVNKRTFECRMSVCRGLLPCLASIVACEALGLVLDLHRGCAYFLNLGPEEIPLMKTTSGHLCVSLTDYPEVYPPAPEEDNGKEIFVHHPKPQRIYIAAIGEDEDKDAPLHVQRIEQTRPTNSQPQIWMPVGQPPVRVDLLDEIADDGQCHIRLPDKAVVRAKTTYLHDISDFADPTASDFSLEGIAGAATRALSGYLAGPEQWARAVPGAPGAKSQSSRETFRTTSPKSVRSKPTARYPGLRTGADRPEMTENSSGRPTTIGMKSSCLPQQHGSEGNKSQQLVSQKKSWKQCHKTQADRGELSIAQPNSLAAKSKKPTNHLVHSGAPAGKGEHHGRPPKAPLCSVGGGKAEGSAAYAAEMAEAPGDNPGVRVQP